MRRFRTPLVWFVAALCALAWWRLRAHTESADESRRSTLVAVGALEPERATRIRLERRGESPMVFSREENGRWVQVEPFACDMDAWSIGQLVALANGVVALRSLEGADRESLGLEPAVATLTFDRDGEGEPLIVHLGKRGPAGRAYASVGDGPPMLVESTLHERAVEADPREWRSRELFPESLGAPDQLLWTLADGAIELKRSGRRWSIVSPMRTRADQARVDDVLAALGRARSDGFVADAPKDLAPFGLDAPVATVRVGSGDSARTLRIGAPVGIASNDRYASLDGLPSVMRLSAGTLGAIVPRIETIIDPRATGVRADDVKRVEIRGKDETVELTRSLDRWTVATVVDGQAQPAVVCPPDSARALLVALTEARAPGVSLAGFPKELEVATVILYGFDDKPLDVVRVARDPSTGQWGFENGDEVLRIHPKTLSVPLHAAEFG